MLWRFRIRRGMLCWYIGLIAFHGLRSRSMTSDEDVCKYRNRGMHDRREGMPGKADTRYWHPAGCGIGVRYNKTTQWMSLWPIPHPVGCLCGVRYYRVCPALRLCMPGYGVADFLRKSYS